MPHISKYLIKMSSAIKYLMCW